jgi:hypothetical protein
VFHISYTYVSSLNKTFQELSKNCASVLSRSGSTGDLIQEHGKLDSMTTSRQCSSPSSNLSASLERMTLTDRHGIITRLEFAKRSISEAMCMLEVEPLAANTTCKKVKAKFMCLHMTH